MDCKVWFKTHCKQWDCHKWKVLWEAKWKQRLESKRMNLLRMWIINDDEDDEDSRN